ncbi:MAG: RNA polymerase sigma-70 factor [Bacteroidales bacterium]|nr:RNA polymerase sigma-70 factor [Bacteroidales bacterium]
MQIYFNRFYEKNILRFTNFACSYVKQRDIAEDIVSDSFVVFLKQLHYLDLNSNLEGYCLTIIKNKSLDYLRQQELHYRAISNMQSAALSAIRLNITSLEACNPSEVFSNEIKQIIKETMNDLGPRTSEVFTLSRLKNKTHKEIAKHLSISIKGVEFHISKALSLLRERLKDYYR